MLSLMSGTYKRCTDLLSKWEIEATLLAWSDSKLIVAYPDERVFVLSYCSNLLRSKVNQRVSRKELKALAESWMTHPELESSDFDGRPILGVSSMPAFFCCGRQLSNIL